jgi:hypothetical protein
MHESILAQARTDALSAQLPLLDEEVREDAELAYRRVMRRVGEAERAPASLLARAVQLLRESRGGRS